MPVATTIITMSQPPPPRPTFVQHLAQLLHVATFVPTRDAPKVGMGFAWVATYVPTLAATQVGTSLAWVATSVPV